MANVIPDAVSQALPIGRLAGEVIADPRATERETDLALAVLSLVAELADIRRARDAVPVLLPEPQVTLPPPDSRRRKGLKRLERSVWFADDEWEQVKTAAVADGMRLHDWVRNHLLVEADLHVRLADSNLVDVPWFLPRRAGRPERVIDPAEVDAALKNAGMSIRGAAKILGIPQATLSGWVRRRR